MSPTRGYRLRVPRTRHELEQCNDHHPRLPDDPGSLRQGPPRHARAGHGARKKLRRVKLGENILLIFENELLIRYQIQEMLRVEKIFEEDGIRHELETYAPLVPDGHNFKVTMQIEYPDEAQRHAPCWPG
jgi:hypothetical protein